MKFINSGFGRRQFLVASISSVSLLLSRSISKAFNPFFSASNAMAAEQSGNQGKKPLKAVVVYFSATGNTGRIAGAMYNGMKTVMPCDVSPIYIDKMSPKAMANYDVIAIGGPIWHFREAAALQLFTTKMPDLTGKLAVLFCTHASNPDSMFYNIERTLRRKGATVIGWNDWYGKSDLSLHTPKPAPTDGHPDDVDLKEAEAFGKEMAQRAVRIFAGERNLIPKIPTGPDADSLWVSNIVAASTTAEGSTSATAATAAHAKRIPVIDPKKCVYPKCTACIDTCIGDAIKPVSAGQASDGPLAVNNCLHCGAAICIRSCAYDAIAYPSSEQIHVINMDKCIHPKCTLCIQYCPQHSIDFSKKPPVFHKNCEACDYCYALCPTGAIEITNFVETHGRLGDHSKDQSPTEYKGFFASLNKAKASGHFRPLVPLDKIGWDTPLSTFKQVPLYKRIEEQFPYHVEKS